MKKSPIKTIATLPVSIPRKIIQTTEALFSAISYFFMSLGILVFAIFIIALIALIILAIAKL